MVFELLSWITWVFINMIFFDFFLSFQSNCDNYLLQNLFYFICQICYVIYEIYRMIFFCILLLQIFLHLSSYSNRNTRNSYYLNFWSRSNLFLFRGNVFCYTYFIFKFLINLINDNLQNNRNTISNNWSALAVFVVQAYSFIPNLSSSFLSYNYLVRWK